MGAAAVRHILGNRHAVLRLQPIYEFATGRPVQHEALLRLLDSVGNEVAPGGFLRTVVQNNLLPAMDMMTVHLLESQLQIPQLVPVMPLTLNISSRTLAHQPYYDYLTSPRWAPMLDRLILELKIGDLMQNSKNIGNLAAFKAQGVGISLNYQSGGAALSKLIAQMGFDYLKFDTRAFCLNYSDEERGQAMDAINVAKEHGVRVVFERVETEQDLVGIKICKPDLVQGYLFGFPQFRFTTGRTLLLGRGLNSL
jgi:EAL domain-containing protein (putative c-di-GMP-specific phosphodiesterase class I)